MLFQNNIQENTRLVQQHISTKYEHCQTTTSEDIHNLQARAAKVGCDEWLETIAELQKFNTSDSNAVVEFLAKEGSTELEMTNSQARCAGN